MSARVGNVSIRIQRTDEGAIISAIYRGRQRRFTLNQPRHIKGDLTAVKLAVEELVAEVMPRLRLPEEI